MPNERLVSYDGNLLTGVRDRAASVLALVAVRTWPSAELNTLVRYLRTIVLPRLREETFSIHGEVGSEWVATAQANYERLSTLTARLERAEPAICPHLQLRHVVEEILRLLIGIDSCGEVFSSTAAF
ncbi:hypothetical protein [Leekyejoonella antrihumi]|nr:hypothetical protein [Leekyejoonella antrihumi]